MEEHTILKQVAEAVEKADVEQVSTLVQQALEANVPPHAIAESGLALGLRASGDRWSAGDIFLPELVCSAEAMKSGMAVLAPHMREESTSSDGLGTAVIGTVQGDIHDIGKSLVATMLTATGFKVIDLGADVPVSRFIETAVESSARLICLSALLTTTMVQQSALVAALQQKGLRDRFLILCGGAPVTGEWVESIGADGTAPDAVSASRLARCLVEK